jgi:hypothetical protein
MLKRTARIVGKYKYKKVSRSGKSLIFGAKIKPLFLWLLRSRNSRIAIKAQQIVMVRINTGARSAGGFQNFDSG